MLFDRGGAPKRRNTTRVRHLANARLPSPDRRGLLTNTPDESFMSVSRCAATSTWCRTGCRQGVDSSTAGQAHAATHGHALHIASLAQQAFLWSPTTDSRRWSSHSVRCARCSTCARPPVAPLDHRCAFRVSDSAAGLCTPCYCAFGARWHVCWPLRCRRQRCGSWQVAVRRDLRLLRARCGAGDANDARSRRCSRSPALSAACRRRIRSGTKPPGLPSPRRGQAAAWRLASHRRACALHTASRVCACAGDANDALSRR